MNEKLNKSVAPLDFGKLWKDVLKYKKLYYKVLSVTFVVSVILLLSIPNYYKCEVLLSPELSRSGSANSLLDLANNFGLNLGSENAGSEALFPNLYPDLIKSTDFKTSLFNVPVTIEGDKEKGEPDRTMAYYDYLKNGQKKTWWSAALGGMKKWVVSLFKDKSPKVQTVDPFRLTEEQTGIVQVIENKVVCDVDQKNLVITIEVTDQNPLICATIADTVKARLQNFITDYHTSKARVDLEYNKKLYRESKARYEKARQKYAEFVDGNQDLVLQTVRQKQTDLENEMQLQYNAYTTVAAQLLTAEARVQEDTPAFITLQRATVPVRKAGPGRSKWCLVFLFLAFVITTAYVFYKEDDLKPLLGLD